MGLFRKAAIFTDIHFGEHLDSEQHNKDCLAFVEWFAAMAQQQQCDTILFLGDWFHNRVRTENRTGHYSRRAIEVLHGLDLPIFWIIGNHELYEKAGREIHSLEHLPRYPNFHLINQIFQVDDVVFAPWLVNDEQNDLIERQSRYVFGHFELPFFLMNQVIEKVYDGNGLHIDDFTNCEAVYSGHFHKRQVRLNQSKIPIYYIGNAFGHNMNDANDPERGMAVLEWGEKLPVYFEWPDAPTYHKGSMSEFLARLERHDTPYGARATIEINDDLGLPDETIAEVKKLVETRHLRINKTKIDLAEQAISSPAQFESLDAMIENKLETMTYDGKFDPKILIKLYRMV